VGLIAGAGAGVGLSDPPILMPWHVPGCIGAWMAPPWGQATVATYAPDNQDFITGWNLSGMGTPTGGQADPYGGTSAVQILETTGSAAYHRDIAVGTGRITVGPATLRLTAKSLGGRNIAIWNQANDDPKAVIDGATGAVLSQNPATATVRVDPLGNGWFEITVYSPSYFGDGTGFATATGSTITAFVGDSSKGLLVCRWSQEQTRVSGLPDLRPAGIMAAYGAANNMSQATAAKQPFLRPNGRILFAAGNQTFLQAASNYTNGDGTTMMLVGSYLGTPAATHHSGFTTQKLSISVHTSPASIASGAWSAYAHAAVFATDGTVVGAAPRVMTAVYNRYDAVDVYTDGVGPVRTTTGIGYPTRGGTTIGDDPSGALYWDGEFCGAAIWSRILSRGEVAQLAAAARLQWRLQ
jgi:hypothetical protein